MSVEGQLHSKSRCGFIYFIHKFDPGLLSGNGVYLDSHKQLGSNVCFEVYPFIVNHCNRSPNRKIEGLNLNK